MMCSSPIADIEDRLFPVTTDASSQCDMVPVIGSSLLNTPTTHRRTPGPSGREVATPASNGETLCGFNDPVENDSDSPQEPADTVFEGAPDNRSGALVSGGRTLFANGTTQEAGATTRTQHEIDGSTETLYQPSLAPPPPVSSAACASTLATQQREAHNGASTDTVEAHTGTSTDTAEERPGAGLVVVASSTDQSGVVIDSALASRPSQAAQRAAPAGCCIGADGSERLQSIYLLVHSASHQAKRNGHSYYVVAHGQDPETLNDVTGIFDSWEESKKYHHRVKGRGTEQFALPTLLEAQCKLFEVLYGREGADGTAFYAAAGGLGGGQPPVALTEGTSARNKNRARDSKSSQSNGGGSHGAIGGSGSSGNSSRGYGTGGASLRAKLPAKVDLTSLYTNSLLPTPHDSHKPHDSDRKRARSNKRRSRSASPDRRGSKSGGSGKRRSKDRRSSRSKSPQSWNRPRNQDRHARPADSSTRTATPRPAAAARVDATPPGGSRVVNLAVRATAFIMGIHGAGAASSRAAASVALNSLQRAPGGVTSRLRPRSAPDSLTTNLRDMLVGPVDAV